MKIIKDYLTKNRYSRPGKKLKSVKGISIHWFANPRSSAKANRNFFENRRYGKDNYGSAHLLIDLNGDIIEDIPLDEIAYHVGSKTYTNLAKKVLGNYPNNCTIGIECAHTNWKGEMTQETYDSLVELCKKLCKQFNLDPMKDLWLHKEIVGWKPCHRWFVDNPIEWQKFKEKVNDNTKKINVKINNGKTKQYKGIIENGTSYVELRALLEDLSIKVDWDDKTKTILINS